MREGDLTPEGGRETVMGFIRLSFDLSFDDLTERRTSEISDGIQKKERGVLI